MGDPGRLVAARLYGRCGLMATQTAAALVAKMSRHPGSLLLGLSLCWFLVAAELILPSPFITQGVCLQCVVLSGKQ